MKYLVVALALALTACPRDPKVVQAEKDLLINAAACTAAGEFVKALSQAGNEPCWLTQLRLQELVATDPDCKAYWGDSGVQVDLECAPLVDGGYRVRD